MMATLTKVSPSRMGPPRFGNRPHNIDSTVRTYQLTPEQLERYRNGEKLEDILREETTMKQLEELKSNTAPVEDDKGIEWLKREVIHAHKLVTEKEEEIARLQELFNEAMTAKEQLQKENLILENQIQRLKEVNDELTERNNRYSSDLYHLEQEVKGLRIYALQKLYESVYGVS
jgi:hypothetical protein